jgi:hypothetical protein
VTTSDSTQPTETTDMSNANEATTTMNTSLITSDSVQLTETTDTPDTTDATTTMAALGTACTINSAVSDIAVTGTPPSEGKEKGKGKGKGKMRKVKDFFRRR